MKNYTSTSSKLSKGENNDCVVRTLAVGFGWSYDKSHKFCSEVLDRKPKQGVYEFPFKMTKFTQLLKEEYGVNIKRVVTETWYKKKNKFKDTWVRQFINEHPQGTFIICGVDHAWIIKDGVIKDWPEFKEKIYRTIKAAFQVL